MHALAASRYSLLHTVHNRPQAVAVYGDLQGTRALLGLRRSPADLDSRTNKRVDSFVCTHEPKVQPVDPRGRVGGGLGMGGVVSERVVVI